MGGARGGVEQPPGRREDEASGPGDQRARPAREWAASGPLAQEQGRRRGRAASAARKRRAPGRAAPGAGPRGWLARCGRQMSKGKRARLLGGAGAAQAKSAPAGAQTGTPLGPGCTQKEEQPAAGRRDSRDPGGDLVLTPKTLSWPLPARPGLPPTRRSAGAWSVRSPPLQYMAWLAVCRELAGWTWCRHTGAGHQWQGRASVRRLPCPGDAQPPLAGALQSLLQEGDTPD